MSTKIFVNLPVKDLEKAMDFYTRLGFRNNPQFTDDTAACMVLTEEIYVMLLTHAKFQQFTPKQICDANKSCEVLNCLTCENRAKVDELVGIAAESGGAAYAEAKDYGFMYQHGFQDLDGHIWELVYMDPSAIK